MKSADKKASGVLTLHLAVLFFGLSGVIGKWVNVPAVSVAWGRSLCSSVILLAFIRAKGVSLKLLLKSDYILALIGGVILALHWTTFFLSIKTSSVAIGTITFSAFPLFVTFIEPLVFRERLEKRDVFLAAMMLAGVAVTVPMSSIGGLSAIGAAWGLVSSAAYAALSLINRYLASKYKSVQICFYQQFSAAVVLLPFVLLSKTVWRAYDIAGVLAIGIFCTALAFSLFVSAQRHVKAKTAGIVSGMETVYGIVFASLLLGERPEIRELLGGVIILASAMASTLKKER
ncbi:MAG: DMT family transporter [Clostridiaceae bacterium]|nr:DMT family transporter [Clostridiaceae bacterium]